MRLWSYYAVHTFINSIKKIFHSTFLMVVAVMIAMFVFMGIIGSVLGYTISTQIDKNSDTQVTEITESTEAAAGTEAVADTAAVEGTEAVAGTEAVGDTEEEEFSFEFSTAKIGDALGCDITGIQFVEIVIFICIIIFIVFGIYNGTKHGSEIFLMPDVNFLFTAPMKPQSVMMFRLTFQMAAAFVASLYMLAQIPNLINGFGLKPFAIFALLFGWFVLLILSRVFSVFTYTVCSTYEKLKKYVLPVICAILAGTFIPAGYIYSTQGKDMGLVLKAYTAGWLRYIPIVGWYKGMIGAALEDDVRGFFIYTALMVAGFAAMIAVVWNIKADFYESAMTGAKIRQEKLDKAKENKPQKKKSTKRTARKAAKEITFRGFGASTFFHKEMLIYRRFAIGGIISNNMAFFTGAVAAITIFVYKGFEFRGFPVTAVTILSMIYLKGLGNPIASDTNATWLVLTPDNPYKKLFMLMMGGTAKMAIDLAPAIIGTAIFTQANPVTVILWYITALAVDFMLSAVGILMSALVPVKGMDTVRNMLQAILKMFLLVVMVVVFAVGFLLGGWNGAIISNMIAAVVAGGVIFLIYPSMLHEGIG